MLIDSLTIAAFRGIRNEIELDLSAPITVLYAPNGTGKTSICDSIEWLITSKVRRLEGELAKAEYQGLRNYSAGERTTFVRCSFAHASQQFNIRRTASATDSRLEQLRRDWRGYNDNDLLTLLSPPKLPARSTRQQNLNRATWFRAVRFLEAPNLDLLLDDTDTAQQVRTLLFAELFGLGEIQERQQKLQKVLDAMTPPSRVQSEIVRLRAEVQQRTAAITQASAQVSAPFRETARENLSHVASHLQWELTDAISLEEAHAKLQDRLRIRLSTIGRTRDSLNTVLAQWDHYQSTAQEVTRLEAEQKLDEQQMATLRLGLKNSEIAVRDTTAAWNRCVAEEQEIKSFSLENLSTNATAAVQAYSLAEGDVTRPLDLAGLQVREQSVARQKSGLQQHRRALANAAEKLSRWLEVRTELQNMIARQAELRPPAEAEVAENDRLLAATERESQQLETEFNRLSAPLQRLRTEGIRVAQSLGNDPHCPLCAHDHGSAEHLLAAIETGLRALPIALTSLASKQKTNAETLQTLREKKSVWSGIQAERNRLEQSIAGHRETMQLALTELQQVGNPTLEISMPDLADRFRAAQRAIETEVESLAADESKVTKLRQAVDRLQEIVQAAKATLDRFNALSPAHSSPGPDLSQLAVQRWGSAIADLKVRQDQISADLALKTSNARRTLDETAGKLQTVQSQITATIDPRSARDAQLGRLRPVVLRVLEVWEQAGNTQPITLDAIDKALGEVARNLEALEVASTRLNAASDALANARQASERERQSVAERQNLSILEKQLSDYERVNRRRGIINDAVTSLHSATSSFITSQVQPLCDVITALYCRAQSNPFITKIEASEQNGMHHWKATADEISLEAIAQMSQGQRQDLALAIFLSRARQIRGTFFLDEPLLHLDDLNRVGLLDILRVIVSERRQEPLRFIITTASNALLRHFREKFHSVSALDGGSALRIYRLSGNPISQVNWEIA